MYEETKETWAEQALEFLGRVSRKEGCHDHSCLIGKIGGPGGMGTNGGCNCRKEIRRLQNAYRRIFAEPSSNG